MFKKKKFLYDHCFITDSWDDVVRCPAPPPYIKNSAKCHERASSLNISLVPNPSHASSLSQTQS